MTIVFDGIEFLGIAAAVTVVGSVAVYVLGRCFGLGLTRSLRGTRKKGEV
jgi:membrane protein DedA with SNARE-associated domain